MGIFNVIAINLHWNKLPIRGMMTSTVFDCLFYFNKFCSCNFLLAQYIEKTVEIKKNWSEI